MTEVTEDLRMLAFLGECDRQAAIFSAALDSALESSSGDCDLEMTWGHLQSGLFAAIIVSRLVSDSDFVRPWPGLKGPEAKREAREVKNSRARRLRELLGVSPASNSWIFKVSEIRDPLEHIDERLDWATQAPEVASISDWYISDGRFLVTPGDGEPGSTGLRAFWPAAGVLMFDRERLDLFALDIDMHRVRHNAREAIAELRRRIVGRPMFGGQQVVQDQSSPGERQTWWQTERQLLIDEMPTTAVDDRTLMWAEIGAPSAQA